MLLLIELYNSFSSLSNLLLLCVTSRLARQAAGSDTLIYMLAIANIYVISSGNSVFYWLATKVLSKLGGVLQILWGFHCASFNRAATSLHLTPNPQPPCKTFAFPIFWNWQDLGLCILQADEALLTQALLPRLDYFKHNSCFVRLIYSL